LGTTAQRVAAGIVPTARLVDVSSRMTLIVPVIPFMFATGTLVGLALPT
jgi:hypothetical protein